MEGALLSVENVSVYYHTPQGETEAVRDLSFSVEPGAFVAVVGPSGCGKTTMLSLIMGLNPPSKGRVCFPMGPCPMGYMLQRDNLLEWRTLEKNAVLGLEVQHKLNEATRGGPWGCFKSTAWATSFPTIPASSPGACGKRRP